MKSATGGFARLLALTAMVAAMLATTPAHADAVACGTVITETTVLHHNVGPCSDNGLIVGADGIVLDLNGHVVFGMGQPFDGAGILVSGRRNVEVRDGTVQNFDAGVAIEGGSSNRVIGITARNNVGQSGNPFATPPVPGTLYGDGIAILSSTDNLIQGNTALHNGPFSGIGVFEVVDSDHPRNISGPATRNTITGNVVRANNECRTPQGACDNDGIRIEPGVDFTVVSHNYVAESGLDGISLFRTANDNLVEHNVVEHNGFHRAAHRKGDGIRVFSDRNVIRNNSSFHNAADGIGVAFVTPRGILRPAVQNRILDNQTGFNRGFDLHDLNPNCDANVWSGNTYRTADPACTTG